MITLLGSAVRADLISIDFNRRNVPTASATPSGTVTDANGDTSLPGQTGLWNQLLMGVVDDPETLEQPAVANTTMVSSLKDGIGTVTSVSLTLNTNNATYYAYDLDTTTRSLLHSSWVGLYVENAPMDWVLSGLKPNTVYRLRMFGRESAGASASPAKFTATGATTDSGFSIATRSYVDLSVKSTAEGEILGTMGNIGTEFGAWSGMQIEWDLPSVISMDFNMASVNFYPGPTASGTVADLNGALSMPGQAGTWNAVLMGQELVSDYNNTNNEVKVVSLLDGGGDATTVSFNFNTSKATYTAFANPYLLPNLTALHRDCVYSSGTLYWQIDGLQPSTEYTLKFFGFQETSGTRLFANFSATGINTTNSTTSGAQNYVDLVVTSTVSGVITGTKSLVNGSWSGMQIQSSEPFPQANPDLISIDFDRTAALPTQSGLNIDANGDTSLPGQSGTWNSLLFLGGWAESVTTTVTSGTLKNGAGVDTSVSLVINPTNQVYWSADKSGASQLNRDFIANIGYKFVEWQLANLEANTVYRLRMFGAEYSNVPTAMANFRATGATTNVASTYFNRNQADLWVTSTSGGTISGILGGSVWGQGGTLSGMQIEKYVEIPVPPMISIDFGYADGTPHPGPVASYTQVDMNGDQSLPGQVGDWNELLTGNGATGTSNNTTDDKPQITGLLDGEGNATTVSFTFNTGGTPYVTFASDPAQPKLTALHRDCIYISPAQGIVYWRIAGLTASTEYTLKLFGLQTAAPTLFGDFSATGINTVSGTNSASQNYVDLVVTSTVLGQITGTVKALAGQDAGSWSGIQIQASGSMEPFSLASNLISLDFETASTTAKTPTASGVITDSNGDSSWGQVGVWNSLLSGTTEGNENQVSTLRPIVNNMFDGLGNATTVDFQFNTGTTAVSYYVYSIAGALLGDMFGITATPGEASWKLTGLQPYEYYTMRMFGQVGSNHAIWEATGMSTASGGNSAEDNFVDVTVAANGAGVITGKLIFTGAGGAGGASWTGMQILKLTDAPFVPAGTLFMIQ
jgi:hypothetical protein